MLLCLYKNVELARGSESLDSIEQCHPGFAADFLANYKRGIAATERYEN
jgi:hypothetical protein